MDISLQPVTEEDFEELADLRVAAMKESLERVGRFDVQRARDRLRKTFSPEHTRMIVLASERVGFVAVVPTEDGLRLDHLYLHPTMQNRGIGGRVLRAICEDADRRGLVLSVGALKQSASNRFYQRHGFVQEAEEDWDVYYVRRPARSHTTVTLYRPVGPKELALIEQSGWKAFPPRLPEQPIFYPVTNEAYAVQIARDWNVKESGSGFVTRFEVDAHYASKFPRKVVGAREHEELWVPAEELGEFNANIVGPIEVIRRFPER